jgi:hypothetical protein
VFEGVGFLLCSLRGLHTFWMLDTGVSNSLPITIERLVAFGHDEHNEQIDNYGVHLPVGE